MEARRKLLCFGEKLHSEGKIELLIGSFLLKWVDYLSNSSDFIHLLVLHALNLSLASQAHVKTRFNEVSKKMASQQKHCELIKL